MEHTDEYTLTNDEQGMVRPLVETIDNLQKEVQTVLRAITRLRGLEGNFNLVDNKLIRVNPPRPVVQELQAVGAPDRNGKE